MRLTAVLLEHPQCAIPRTYALAALMCLHAARLPARIDASGNDGPDRGIEEIQAITDRDRLNSYPFYWAALGEFELRANRYESAHGHALNSPSEPDSRSSVQNRYENPGLLTGN